jgi:hypothetical protein
MLKVNSYFDDSVKSIGFENAEGNATVGVMDIGDYEFGTSTTEFMTVISGALTVLLPNAEDWKVFGKGETFVVPANVKFKLKVTEQTAYCCFYK